MSGFISQFSIRAKLIMAFATILFGTIAMGVFAVQRLDGVSATAADLRDNWLPASRALGDAGRSAEQIRIQQQLQPLAVTPADRSALIATIQERTKRFRNQLEKYMATIDLDDPTTIIEETRLASAMKSAWAAYEALSQKYQDLLDQGKP